jgi:NAD-dependent deacetylase
MDRALKQVLDLGRAGPVVVLTGAGVSAESGIPTFRGEEGYWTVGSSVYHPQELATHAAYLRTPDLVWQWYLYRRTVCRRARPNPAHQALAALERRLGDRLTLITQNVDGLHLRAGSSLERTYQIHGNIDFMRCGRDCCAEAWALPDGVGEVDRGAEMRGEHRALLCCPRCGERARPHVLWFDECYDEPRFRFESSLAAAERAALLIVVGTSASTNLPWHVVRTVAGNRAGLIDINIDDNPFAEIARELPTGVAVRGRASELIPAIAEELHS